MKMTEESYEKAKSHWDSMNLCYRRPDYSPKSTNGKDFIRDLKQLHVEAGEDRFREVIEILFEWQIVDVEGKWNRKFNSVGTEADHKAVISQLQQALIAGASYRVAYAVAAAEIMIRASNFEAACAQARRIWARRNRSVTKPP